MESYESLRDKWRRRLEQGTASHDFGLDELAPAKFCVLYSDCGSSGACCSANELIGVFEDPRDFLGFLRFAEIPRVLDFYTGTSREPVPGIADSYLLDLEEGAERDRIDNLLGLLDRSLKLPKGEMIPVSELSAVCDQFNISFEGTNPSVQILARGTLAEVLASDRFEEAFEEEMDEDEKPSTVLKTLLDADEFDENNKEHLALARGFLERSIIVY